MSNPKEAPQTQLPSLIKKASWNGINVEYGLLDAVGEFDFAMPKNAISIAFAPHDKVTWSVDGGSSKTTRLPAGSAFIYGNRNFVWHKRERHSEYINIMLEPQFLEQVASENDISTPVEIQHKVIFLDSTILQVGQLMKSEILNGGVAGELYTESLRNLLAVHLLRNYTETSEKQQLEDGALDGLKLQQVKDFIEDNLAESLTIADIAAVLHMSQFHFARVFKAATGESPHRYVTQRRMERAKVLLEVTKFPVAEVAYRVGFYNPSHFTSQFRKYMGMTPKKYRDGNW
ncbi:DNA-binding domain-containing protein, AraC-type [Rivularia sp. PCC 7116]|uniref:AraC family transcriptional regulator n=1 Tax=Rivularia sp. PCC 7116 TaxID=373994 RepID=UPI00029F0309|nr:AraC family transcriptional regulator [Rivularia sp. PCC 7116]AFY57105.1 DNA-binding domain-containing protein, AraC-type [Rivularia sp. PCC 7116]